MQWLSKALAIILGIMICVMLPASLVLHDAGEALLSESKMAELLDAELIESGFLREFVAQAMLGEMVHHAGEGDGDVRQIFGYLSPGEREEILDMVLPPGWARTQLASLVGELYYWLDNPHQELKLAVDLRPIKARLLGGNGRRLADLVIDSWPSCTPEELNDFEQQAREQGRAPLLCEAPQPYRSSMVRYATRLLEEMTLALPDDLPLAGEERLSLPEGRAGIAEHPLRAMRVLSRGSWMLPLSLLGLIMALAIRSWRDLGIWWGIPTLMAGLLTFLLAAIGKRLAPLSFSALLELGNIPPELAGRLSSIEAAIREAILEPLTAHALILVVMGMALLAFGWFLSRSPGQRLPLAEHPGA